MNHETLSQAIINMYDHDSTTAALARPIACNEFRLGTGGRGMPPEVGTFIGVILPDHGWGTHCSGRNQLLCLPCKTFTAPPGTNRNPKGQITTKQKNTLGQKGQITTKVKTY